MGIKVLSLFDGMSCGQIALDQLGVEVDTYYASEIDKWAMQITQKNYPNTIQVGDVCDLDPKDFQDVDLIMGGSPCQGFSFAGKQLAFDDPRSALFFQFVRLLEGIKPKYFLLENVKMKKEYLQVITDLLGIEPIFINSALVSAQSRQRYYWTNIPNIKEPEDRGIVLKDILENNFSSEKDKSYCIDANYFKGASVEQYKKKSRRQLVSKPKQIGKPMSTTQKKIERNKRNLNEKAVPLLASTYKGIGNNGTTIVPDKDLTWRKLTPLECERLQTVPDNYTEGVSNTQRYKMLGNGWTVEVIKHILRNMA